VEFIKIRIPDQPISVLVALSLLEMIALLSVLPCSQSCGVSLRSLSETTDLFQLYPVQTYPVVDISMATQGSNPEIILFQESCYKDDVNGSK